MSKTKLLKTYFKNLLNESLIKLILTEAESVFFCLPLASPVRTDDTGGTGRGEGEFVVAGETPKN